MNNKKGQGISINMIIIVAIALIVLIVMVILVARSGSDFGSSTKCITKGGICKDSTKDPCPPDRTVDESGLCGDPTKGQVCCRPV